MTFMTLFSIPVTPRHGCLSLPKRAVRCLVHTDDAIAERNAISGRAIATLAAAVVSLTTFSSPVVASESRNPVVSDDNPDCIDCIGEVDSTLNRCLLGQVSCVSSYSEDEEHFYAPWEYETSTSQAIETVISIATGGPYRNVVDTPFARDRGDVAKFILQGTAAVSANRPDYFPGRPEVKRQDSYAPFTGRLVDRHTTRDGSTYLRFVFDPDLTDKTRVAGQGEPIPLSEPAVRLSSPTDVEFVFTVNDTIVTARASSRRDPDIGKGSLKLSFNSLFEFDRNEARTLLECLRRAAGFTVTPVVTDFDPRFNNARQLWFERFFEGSKELPDLGDRYPLE